MSSCEMSTVALPSGPLGRFATGLRAFRKLIRNPADPLHGPIFQLCVEHSLLRRLTRRLLRNSEGRRLFAERPRLNAQTVSLATFATHPPRSLGQAYARYFEDNGIHLFEPPVLPVETDQHYLA